jgi:hypothetical protein
MLAVNEMDAKDIIAELYRNKRTHNHNYPKELDIVVKNVILQVNMFPTCKIKPRDRKPVKSDLTSAKLVKSD